MRPAHIRVFDGLRITTDHLEHLQGSFSSAVQELRQVAGLGRVHEGFDIQVTDGTQVTVQPGVAFDLSGNRIACDEPTVLKVVFPTSGSSLYVCLRHEQVEDAVVEGQATIVWDGCSVLLSETRPSPEDSLIPIAELRPNPGEDGFEIRRIPTNRPKSAMVPPPSGVVVTQGVLRMDGHGDDSLASPVIRETPYGSSAGGSHRQAGSLLLATREVAVGASPCSLSLQAMISATLRRGATLPVANEPNTVEASVEENAVEPTATDTPWTALELRAKTSGEATMQSDQLTQFGIADLYRVPSQNQDWDPQWCGCYLTEGGIAHLPVYEAWPRPNEARTHVLDELQIRLKVEPGATPGCLALRCELSWSAGTTAGPGNAIQATTQLQWCVVAAWKALAHLAPAEDVEGGN